MNARQKLIVTGVLLCLALGLTVFCAVQTVQAIQSFQQDHKLAMIGDVSTIRSWMTVPYIARFYHVPENYLDEQLHIADAKSIRHFTLRALADRTRRPVNSLIYDIQHAILNYRKQHTGANARVVPIDANLAANEQFPRAWACPRPGSSAGVPLARRKKA